MPKVQIPVPESVTSEMSKTLFDQMRATLSLPVEQLPQAIKELRDKVKKVYGPASGSEGDLLPDSFGQKAQPRSWIENYYGN